MKRAVLLMQCADQPGIVARATQFLFSIGANLMRMDQHNTSPKEGQFFLRAEFSFDDDRHTEEEIRLGIRPLAQALDADYSVYFDGERLRMGVLVSKMDHVLYDLLYRWKSGEWNVDIPFVVSNHEDLSYVAEMFGVSYHYVPVTKETKGDAEKKILELIGESDFLVLARYMQILTADFIAGYGRDIINIHHSFLPSFKGAHPYRQAYERGVKVIGATAHFVNEDLDEGPIIEQVVERVSHRDLEDDLRRKGKNLEKLALAHAVEAYIGRRILRNGRRTIVFG